MPPLALPPPGDTESSWPPPDHGRARQPAWRRLSKADYFALLSALALTLGGVFMLATAAGWNLAASNAQRAWVALPEGQRAEQVASAPTPIWLPQAGPTQPSAPTIALSTGDPLQSPGPAVVRGQPSTVELLDASFIFIEPPEPGAHARFWLSFQVSGTQPLSSLGLAIPNEWFDGYRLAATAPTSTMDARPETGAHQLVFSRLQPGPGSLFVDVVATTERVDPPRVQVTLPESGVVVGEAHPRTVAPRPRPGPVSALRIPRLGLSVAVVPTAWEPPAFVAGQIRGSANITQGNTVLVGHLGGAAGDVFKHLDQLQPGDNIVAVSRGLEYSFVVSDTQTLPADDSQPTAPLSSARLTLMTCTGTWDPLARNYSDRLWVTAEPPDLASATIAANAQRPPTPVPSTAAATAGSDAAPAVLASVGLGAERDSLDASLGPPLGETPGKLVVYRQGSAEYHVGFTEDPPRVQLMEVVPVGGGAGLSVPTAVLDPTAWGGQPGDFIATSAGDNVDAILQAAAQ